MNENSQVCQIMNTALSLMNLSALFGEYMSSWFHLLQMNEYQSVVVVN